MTHNEEAKFYSDLLRAYFDSASDAIFVLCDEMKFLTCNKMTQEWLGRSEDDLTQHNQRIPITELLGDADSSNFFSLSFKQALNNEDVVFETHINPKDGKERWIELSMKRVDIENGDMVIAIARDITQRKKNIATIEYKTNYDQLTSLPNKSYLKKSLSITETEQHDETETSTLLTIDIDRFKDINESLGHHSGDIVLQELAQRLNRLIDHSSGELLARLEGDEFAFLLPGTSTVRAQEVAVRLKNIISMPLTISNNTICIDCSIGIANYPEHTDDRQQLIQFAESAMYFAKTNKQGIGVYSAESHKSSTDRLQLITSLRIALGNGEITPHYQPIIKMTNPDELHIEALARWEHESLGFISPEIFVPLAEEIGMINALTSNILDKSIGDCADLLKQKIIKKLSVNISAYCMTNTELVGEIKQLLERYQVSPDQIIFEITESAIMSNLKTSEIIINDLHRSGITFSIDDFGTGYSSLVKLKQLPLSELKIDKSFVLEILDNENDTAIAKASIEMAHALGLEVVAEGIENKDSWDLLQTMGCDYCQGFWMARPMPLSELHIWLKK